MPDWAVWTIIGFGVWVTVSVVVALVAGRGIAALGRPMRRDRSGQVPDPLDALPQLEVPTRRRLLLVDDDAGLRVLLRTTLGADECAVEETASAEEAADLARFWRPSLVVLDVGLPGMSGLAFCRELKENPVYDSPRVILLTGGETRGEDALDSKADALLRKPFSPLDLLGVIDRLLEGEVLPLRTAEAASADQLLAYARDLQEIVQVERAQRRLLQHAYRQTVTAFTDALEARNEGTGQHALRVHRYALELTEAVEPGLLGDASLEYGFLLHDIGKIGIPDAILDKAGPLQDGELRLMRRHPLIGAQLLADVPLLDGEGLQVVRSHHERWDGSGYPDGLVEEEIPKGARIFAVADALDAMTTDRPYRPRLSWDVAVDEILRESGHQFDPQVVSAFARREQRLRRTQHELAHVG
ncbi:MAG TPA: HD domain-containing phosphohydrolase [Gaiellaceae bacterium]|nr:HD domain-containing phosphohydrolase [Gaiellaceae bacterium]